MFDLLVAWTLVAIIRSLVANNDRDIVTLYQSYE